MNGQHLGNSALILASGSGHLDVVRYLVEQKAKVNDHNYLGQTALIVASKDGRLDSVPFLLEQKANVNAQSSTGSSALMLASLHNQLQIIPLLLAGGADLSLKGTFYEGSKLSTALEIAEWVGRKEAADLLREAEKQQKEGLATKVLEKRASQGPASLG